MRNEQRMSASGMVSKRNETICLFIFATVLMIIALIRCFFCVEITDEAFYIADSISITNGAIPYVTHWFQSSGYAVVAAPLIKVYHLLNGGYEGLFLYTRIMYTLVKGLLLIWGGIIIRNVYSTRTAVLFLAPMILFAPYSISNFSYNTIPLLLNIVTACYMTRLVKRGNARDAVIMAILIAVATFLNPTNAITAIWYFVVLFVFSIRNVISKGDVWKYVVAGFSTAAIVCLILCILSGGVGTFIEGFTSLLKYNPYFYHKNLNIPYHRIYIRDMMFGAVGCACLCVVCYILLFKISERKKRAIRAMQIGMMVFIGAICIRYCNDVSVIMRVMTGGLLFIPPALCIIYKSLDKKLLFVWWFPNILHMVISSVTAYHGISDRAYLLLPAVLIVTMYSEEVFKENGIRALNLLPICLSFALMCVLYGYTYRDADLLECDTMVEEGIYKGIFTTKEKGEYYVKLENYIHEVTTSEDYVYAQQAFQALYIMSEGKMLAPVAWYSFVFWDYSEHTGDEYVLKYYEFMQKEPDVILYHYNNGPIVDIKEGATPFAQFINEKYEEMEGNEELPEFTIYRRKKDGSK